MGPRQAADGQDGVGAQESLGQMHMQACHDGQRDTRQHPDRAHRGLRIGRGAAHDLRQRCRLRRDAARDLERMDREPQGKTDDQARQRLRPEEGQRGQRARHGRQVGQDGGGEDRGEGQRGGEPDPDGDHRLAQTRQDEETPTHPQEDRDPGGKPELRGLGQQGKRAGHGAASPTREGLASIPISSNDRTGLGMPRACSTVRRKRRRSAVVTMPA